jgi:hypothetical protein
VVCRRGLALYCVVLTAVTGDIGFDGDDWWSVLSRTGTAFRTRGSTRKFLRPLEGLYWISLFELFGFNKVVFHLCSLLLLAGSALMGVCWMGFSRSAGLCFHRCVAGVFLPPVSCLTVLFTDNSG